MKTLSQTLPEITIQELVVGTSSDKARSRFGPLTNGRVSELRVYCACFADSQIIPHLHLMLCHNVCFAKSCPACLPPLLASPDALRFILVTARRNWAS